MKRWVKFSIFSIVLVIAVVVISLNVLSNKKPIGKSGYAANALAVKMEMALGKSDFDDVRFIRWTFMGTHHYVWDKSNQKCIVEFDDVKVLLNLKDYKNGSKVLSKNGNNKIKNTKPLIEKAYKYFCNDSFWLLAPFKVFDKNTERYIVTKSGKDQLLVEFNDGGVTPGDAYLFTLDEENKPERVYMWTSNLPIKGMQFCWDDYKSFKNNGNLSFATSHKLFKLINISTDGVEVGNSLSDIKQPEDSFLQFQKA